MLTDSSFRRFSGSDRRLNRTWNQSAGESQNLIGMPIYDCVETFHKVIRSMSGGTKLPFGKTASNSLLGSSPRPMALKITNLLNLKWKSHNFLLPVQPGELSSHVWLPVFPRLLWELRHLLLFPSCSWQHFAFLVNMRWCCWPCGVRCHCPWSYDNINWLGAHYENLVNCEFF